MNLYFKDKAFSFQLLRQASLVGDQGAEIGEVLATASQIKEGDFESWYEEFQKTAERIEKIGKECLSKGHIVSAREAFLRAHTYFKASEFFLNGTDPKRKTSFLRNVEDFEKAMALMDFHFEKVKIPYEGTYLQGYFYSALDYDNGLAQSRPTLVCIGGYDSTLQELYFFHAAAAIKYGYNCLIFEGPGQGGAIMLQNIPMRYDYEVPIMAAIDYLETRNDIDKDKIALLGMSFGGYFAPRAAAFDKRIKACVAFDILYEAFAILNGAFAAAATQNSQLAHFDDLSPEEKENVLIHAAENNAHLRWMLNNGVWVMGLKHRYELFEEAKKYSIEGITEKITCPLLLLVGEADHFISSAQLQLLLDALKCPKTVRIFTAEEGAEEHCQLGNLSLFHQVMYDWLDEIFKGPQ